MELLLNSQEERCRMEVYNEYLKKIPQLIGFEFKELIIRSPQLCMNGGGKTVPQLLTDQSQFVIFHPRFTSN